MTIQLELTTDRLFHVLWDKAVGTPTYNKTEWLDLQARMHRLMQTGQDATVIIAREDIRLSAAADIAKWLRSSVLSARYGSDTWHLRRQLAIAIESGDWLIHENNEGPR